MAAPLHREMPGGKEIMRAILIVAALTLFTVPPLFAQTERAYVTGAGGFAVAPDATSRDVVGEVGVRLAPRLLVFGNLGRFHNLQASDADPTVTSTAAIAAGTGLDVNGTSTTPAWYSTGGVRFEIAPKSAFTPYVLGGVGVARMTPNAHFTYASGLLPDGTAPGAGADITSALETAGDYTPPSPTSSLMYTLGGGVDVPVKRHWDVDAGDRYSRIAADSPFNVQGMTFGVGYRF
jgi:opacity protein-like surface antigen